MSWPFQIAYEGYFWSLCTVTFGQEVDFLNSNTCTVSARDYMVYKLVKISLFVFLSFFLKPNFFQEPFRNPESQVRKSVDEKSYLVLSS